MFSVYVISVVGLVGGCILWLLLRAHDDARHIVSRREFTALSMGLWVNGAVWMKGVDLKNRWFWMSRAQNRELQIRLGEDAKWDAIAEEAIKYWATRHQPRK